MGGGREVASRRAEGGSANPSEHRLVTRRSVGVCRGLCEQAPIPPPIYQMKGKRASHPPAGPLLSIGRLDRSIGRLDRLFHGSVGGLPCVWLRTGRVWRRLD